MTTHSRQRRRASRDEPFRLTSFARCAGCAAKLGPGDLSRALSAFRYDSDPRLLVGRETFDDAGVFMLSDDLALVQTVDFFAPIVDDPYLFGQIAAANALSDVYAMGGEPITALNIVGFPAGKLPTEVLSEILRGGQDKVHEAGALVVGGHSIIDEELKFGLSVTGRVHPKRILSNACASVGDRLVLTKPLGTGLLATAGKRGDLGTDEAAALYASMCKLNGPASRGDRRWRTVRHRRDGIQSARPRFAHCRGEPCDAADRSASAFPACLARARRGRGVFVPVVLSEMPRISNRSLNGMTPLRPIARCSWIHRRQAGCSSPCQRGKWASTFRSSPKAWKSVRSYRGSATVSCLRETQGSGWSLVALTVFKTVRDLTTSGWVGSIPMRSRHLRAAAEHQSRHDLDHRSFGASTRSPRARDCVSRRVRRSARSADSDAAADAASFRPIPRDSVLEPPITPRRAFLYSFLAPRLLAERSRSQQGGRRVRARRGDQHRDDSRIWR